MKVLLVATVQSHICQFHRPLASLLHEHGCEVHAAARDNLAEKNGLKLDFVEKAFNIPFERSPFSLKNRCACRKLKEVIDAGHYDVIHCNTPVGGVLGRLAARKARKKGTKIYYTAHGFHFYRGAPKKNWLLWYPVEKIMSRLTDKLITVTEEDHRLAQRRFPCAVFRIHGVGVDENRYFPVAAAEQLKLRGELGFSDRRKIILCVGELLPNKNQRMAVRMLPMVLRRFPEALLLIAGNGPEKEQLKKLIREYHVENQVRLLGYCSVLEKYQRIADVLVACSKREGLPLNLVEAMLSETPVVATRNRGHRELIEDGRTGYLVAIDDADEMAQKVCVLLSDSAKHASIRSAARLHAMQYGRETVKKELAEIYDF